MNRSLALFFALSACTPFEPGDLPDEAEYGVGVYERVTCDPQMHVFPIADDHNIGYDHASCGTDTCEISCPDAHANSDWGGAHHGIDVFAYQGAPLVAVADADVVAVGVVSATSGLRVRLRDACGWEYYYGHMDEEFVSVGQHVHAGDLIGTMGRTGTQSTHLHFNVSPNGQYSSDINPFNLLQSTSATACAAAPPPVSTPQPAPQPAPAPAPAPAGCGTVGGTTIYTANQSLGSCDGRFSLVMQGDGNLVLYRAGGTALWHTQTHGNPGAWAVMQGDGNLVVYSVWGTPLWSSGTHGHAGSTLAVQNDGNVVIYAPNGAPLWNTGTWGN
ncbi:MAG: peptidoglycan DD-metalloendopeptidase family protein [Myxococcota bacterium]